MTDDPALSTADELRLERERMRTCWSARGRREGLSSVLSTRYPVDSLNAESDRCVKEFLGFIGRDLDGRHVLEVGPGPGRFTKPLLERVDKLTVAELCPEMLVRLRDNLGHAAARVEVLDVGFAQEVCR